MSYHIIYYVIFIYQGTKWLIQDIKHSQQTICKAWNSSSNAYLDGKLKYWVNLGRWINVELYVSLTRQGYW